METRYALGFYLGGAAAARTGDEMSGPALLLAGLAVTGSAAEASLLLAALTVAAAVGGPVFGALLDRSPAPGRLLAGALAVYGGGLALVLLALGHLPLPLTAGIALLTGLAGPALAGGWTSQLPRVVPPSRLPGANALDAMTFQVASLLGPALAGAVASLCGAPPGVVVAVALIVLALPTAWFLPSAHRAADGPDPGPGPSPGPEAAPASTADPAGPTTRRSPHGPARAPLRALRRLPAAATVVADIRTGLRCVVRTGPLARATTVSVVSCAGQGVLVTCAPLWGERVLGGSGRGAMLLSGIALSALAANAVLARHPHRIAPDTVVRCSTLVLAAASVVASSGHPVLLAVAVLLAGVGEGPQLTALFAVRHRETPEGLRGQVFTTGASLKITGFALGAALAGPVATWSLTGALLMAAGLQLLAVPCAAALAALTARGRNPAPGAPFGHISGSGEDRPGSGAVRD